LKVINVVVAGSFIHVVGNRKVLLGVNFWYSYCIFLVFDSFNEVCFLIILPTDVILAY